MKFECMDLLPVFFKCNRQNLIKIKIIIDEISVNINEIIIIIIIRYGFLVFEFN
jgi:hypothetical protein